MEECYGGTDVMERSCAVARGIDIKNGYVTAVSLLKPPPGSRSCHRVRKPDFPEDFNPGQAGFDPGLAWIAVWF
jgi:hypothetical protein